MEDKDLSSLIILGDRLLIKPLRSEEKTESGLYLPVGVKEREKVQNGYVVKVGTGYIIPSLQEDEESWKKLHESSQIRYIPLQAKVGDLAMFLLNSATEVLYKKEKYFIVSQSEVLLLERPDF